jgi:LysR family transcriptional regulator, glycine cleavage system transcriptional activator
MKPRLPLRALEVFEAAARHGSFKNAADELSVTPGAVSRQIATLESALELRLFERLNREVRLTGPGRAYFGEIQAAFARIEAASERVGKRGARRVVRVDATPTFALHWLIPRLPDFHARFPGVEVQLGTSVGAAKRGGFDWIVRRDPEHFAGMAAEPFLEERSLLVAAPAAARSLSLRRAADLERCRLIEIKARPDLWPSWSKAQAIPLARFANRLELDQTIYAIQAVLEGLGVAVLPELFVADLLAASSLLAPLREAPVVTGVYHLIAPKAHGSASAQLFREWIRQAASVRRPSGSAAAPRAASRPSRAAARRNARAGSRPAGTGSA